MRGISIQCTQAAPTWGGPAPRPRRIRARGPCGERRRNLPTVSTVLRVREGQERKEAPFQRIELCASGSIRLLGAARLHCTETILFAGDSVAVPETAEVTATGTVILRAPQPQYLPTGPTPEPLNPLSGVTIKPGGPSFEAVAMRLMGALKVGVAGGLGGSRVTAASSDAPASSPSAPLSAPRAPAPTDATHSEEAAKGGSTLPLGAEPELRGGSHGGLGGVASDRCEAKAFSRASDSSMCTFLVRCLMPFVSAPLFLLLWVSVLCAQLIPYGPRYKPEETFSYP